MTSHNSAYNYIKNKIIEGEFEAGKQLTEESLAKELEISRTPVREALNRLENEGLIMSFKRRMFVRSYTSKDIEQIYALRSIMEGYAAGEAARKRTDEDIEELIKINEGFKSAVESIKNSTDDKRKVIKDLYEYNSKFHKKILGICDNPYLEFFISKVTVLPIMYSSFSLYSSDDVTDSLISHNSIIKAIERQDAERAKIGMMEHIYKGRDNALEIQKAIKNKKSEEVKV